MWVIVSHIPPLKIPHIFRYTFKTSSPAPLLDPEILVLEPVYSFYRLKHHQS